MDTSALLGGGLNAAMGIAGQAASGKTKGLGGNIGKAAGGLLGTAFGGPLGSAIGSTAGGLLGGGIESLFGGGKKKRPARKKKARKLAKKQRQVAAAKPAPGARAPRAADVARGAALVTALGGATKKTAVPALRSAAQLLAATKKARTGATNAIGRALLGGGPNAAVNFAAMARAAGLSPTQTLAAARAGVSPGALVRRAGLGKLAKVAGVRGGAAALGKRLGLGLPMMRALGLGSSAPQRARLPARAVHLHVTNVVKCARKARPSRRREVQLAGLEDDPRSLDPGNLKAEPAKKWSGVPGAVPVRKDNWNFAASTYVLEWGDTLSGLAATYLGNAGRWKDIWNAQPSAFRMSRNPSKLQAGEEIKMPPEARDNAQKLAGNPGSQVTPAGKVVDAKGDEVSSVPTWAKVVGGVAAVGVLGGAVYALTR